MSEDPGRSGVPADGLSEEQVARLLAAVAGAEPLPPEVGTRLDGVLAELVAERVGPGVAEDGVGAGAADSGPADQGPADQGSADLGATAPVVPLAEQRGRRRRTWAPRLLAAAVVLGVAGVGINVVGELGAGSSSEESTSAGDAAEGAGGADSADGAEGAGGAEAGDEAGGEGGDEGGDEAPEPAADSLRFARDLRVTDEASLRTAVLLVGGRDTALDERAAERGGAPADQDPRAALKASPDCVEPGGPGRRAAVTYRGSPATLVVRRAGAGLDGRIYDCTLGLQLDGVEIGPDGE